MNLWQCCKLGTRTCARSKSIWGSVYNCPTVVSFEIVITKGLIFRMRMDKVVIDHDV